MTLTTINIGAAPNDRTGDSARAAGAKINALIDLINALGISETSGFPMKPTVKAATTENITLSGAQTIDGVSCGIGDRVLVKDQSSASGNGVYVVASGSWTRAADMDAWVEVPGAIVLVEQGSTQADTGWQCTSNAGGTLGSTAISFVEFSPGNISAAKWAYLAAATAFGGPLIGAANLAALVTAMGGAAAVEALLAPTRARFCAHKNATNQTGIATTTYTKITFDTERFDSGSYYDTSQSRWTPPLGTVRISAKVWFSSGLTSGSGMELAIYKNGALFHSFATRAPGVSGAMAVTINDEANGTDYYEVYGYITTGSTGTASGLVAYTTFEGEVI